MLKPLEKKSLATAVYEQLRDHIVGGELGPGEALPSERVLAEKLAVNRGAVREGLRRLEQAGLVTVQQGGATQVRDFKRTAGLELLGSLVVRDGRVDTKVARSVLELRRALGPELARAAAKHGGAGRLPAIVAEMRGAKGELGALSRLAMEYWGEVVRVADSLAWQLAFNSLEASYGLVREHLVHVLADELTATADYAALAKAIDRHDADGAADLASKIVGRGDAAMRKVLVALDTTASRARAPKTGSKKGAEK